MVRLTREIFAPAAVAGSLAVLLLSFLLGCDRPGGGSALGSAESHGDTIKVKIVRPSRQEIVRSVRLPGTVRADLDVTLYSKVTGYVKSIRKDRGDAVTEGEVIALLEIPEMALEIEHARASAELEEATFKRLEALRKIEKAAVTDQDFDMARAKRAMAQASLKKLETLQGYTEIRAPFSGYVTSRHVDPGALVVPQAKIVSVVSTSKVRVLVDVPESEVRFAKVGTEAELTFEALPGVLTRAAVSRSSKSLEAPVRSMRVELDVPNPQGTIMPGMFAKVQLGVDRHPNALVVPAKAVSFQQDKSFVFVDRDGKAMKTLIVAGPQNGEWREVTSGLEEKDTVVLADGRLLEDGTLISSEGK
jgi:RND family efflux transporter MFP subunit